MSVLSLECPYTISELGTAVQGQAPAPQIIPIIGVWLGYFPLEFGRMFALAFCIYFPATHMLLYYCHDLSHMRSIFFSVIAGNMFWFAYAKARPPAIADAGRGCCCCTLGLHHGGGVGVWPAGSSWSTVRA